MKRTSLFAILALFILPSKLLAATGALVYEVAASTGVQFTISATTTPTLILSTGSFMTAWGYGNAVVHFTSTATPNPGQMLWNRSAFEIYNDAGHDIHIGFNASISSQAGANYARRIPSGAAWSLTLNSPEVYVVSGTTETPRKIVVTQIK